MKRLIPRDPAGSLAELASGGLVPWGDRARVFDLPGGPYRFSGLSEFQAAAIEHRFGPWRLDAARGSQPPSSVETAVFRLKPSACDERSVRGVTSSLAREFEVSEVRMHGLELVGHFKWPDVGLGDGVVRGGLAAPIDGALEDGTSDPRWLDAFENYLRTVVAYRVLALGGVLFHSSGVRTREGVHLFLGPSGAGKTTIARLSMGRGLEVLSDDINAALPGPDGEQQFLVERLPFAGDLASSGDSQRPSRMSLSEPLIGLHRLVQEEGHERRTLSEARRLAALVGSSPFVNADPHRLELLLQTLEPLVPLTDELAFRPDADFWPLLERSLAEAAPLQAIGAAS